MAPAIRHREISRKLLSEILAGKYQSTQRLPSEAQLVKRFRVSRPTVSRALRDLETQGLVVRRAGSGTYLRKDDEPKPGTTQLGLLVPGLGTIEIFEVICGELACLARVHDLGMHWGGSTRPRIDAGMSIAEAEELCERFIEKGVRGVFFAPFEHTTDNESANRRIAERLRHAGITVVLLDRDICAYPHRSEFDLVSIDHFAGGYMLADHLIKLGVQRPTFVSRPFSATTVDLRKAGACSAMMSHNLHVPKEFFQTGDCTDLEYVRKNIVARKFEAVICANDKTAAQLMQSLSRLGTSVPGDLRVVGFDDVRFATLLPVPLTTIHQPCRDIAVTAFDALRERIANPTLPARSLLLAPRLVVRESCGAYPLPR